jgi:hypothetical protein
MSLINKKIRPIHIKGNVAYVILTKGHIAIIDAEDAQIIDGFNWYAKVKPRSVYACRMERINGKSKIVFLHRVLINAPDDMEVDHISGDGLDNRKLNLRLATHAQNQHNQRIAINNTSGYKGASWDKTKRKWKAYIRFNGRLSNLGYFATSEAASEAYKAASAQLHGNFGRIA